MSKKCYCGNEKLDEYSENYWVCNKCHTLVSKNEFSAETYDVEDESEDLYGSNYWQNIMEKMIGETSFDGVVDYYLRDRVIYWISYILKYIPVKSKVAEIGCGLGQLAYAMKLIGYEQLAFELSPQICEFIRENLGVNMHCGEFGDTKETFDAVLAFDLLEHIQSPKEFLKNIYERLTPDGILCVQMPNYDYELTYEKMKVSKPRFLEQMKEKEHVFLYSKEAAVELLKEAGFQDIVFEPACFGDDYDMFLFAAKQKLQPMSDEEVDARLNEVNAGRIIKALYHLYKENKNLQARLEESEKDRTIRLKNAEDLEQRLEESDRDRTQRLQSMQELERRLEESEKDRAARLEIIEGCNQRIIELNDELQVRNQQVEVLRAELERKEASTAALQHLLDLHLAEIKKLVKKSIRHKR